MWSRIGRAAHASRPSTPHTRHARSAARLTVAVERAGWTVDGRVTDSLDGVLLSIVTMTM